MDPQKREIHSTKEVIKMSKKRRKHKITLEIGKFYRVLDGSPGGHPGQISMSEDEFKRLGLRKGYYKLKHSTDQNVDISLIKKRPFIGDRNDYGEKEYFDMSFDDEDMYLIIKVQNSNPVYGKYYKKRKKIKKPH